MESALNQLIYDLSYCIDTLGMKDEHMEDYLYVCGVQDVTPEYFAEEFLLPQGDLHDEDYLSLDSFNAYHGIYFEEVE